MNKTIILPDEEQAGKLIELAWKEFSKEAKANGFPLGKSHYDDELAKDIFVAGYCFGHNDCLGIIRGQIEAMDMAVGFGDDSIQS